MKNYNVEAAKLLEGDEVITAPAPCDCRDPECPACNAPIITAERIDKMEKDKLISKVVADKLRKMLPE